MPGAAVRPELTMQRIFVTVRGLVFDSDNDEGEDLVEYGLLVGLIAVIAVTAVTTVGQQINTVFWQAIAAALGNVA